jgi:hypothetical protein
VLLISNRTPSGLVHVPCVSGAVEEPPPAGAVVVVVGWAVVVVVGWAVVVVVGAAVVLVVGSDGAVVVEVVHPLRHVEVDPEPPDLGAAMASVGRPRSTAIVPPTRVVRTAERTREAITMSPALQA